MNAVAETRTLLDLNILAIVTKKEAVRVMAVGGEGRKVTFFVEVAHVRF